MKSTIFVAGATGVIGYPLCQMLIAAGHRVVGTTRRQDRVARLTAIGVEPVVLDVFSAATLEQAVAMAEPQLVIHQLTDLPPGLPAEQMAEALVRNARLRDEGTRNLVRAAEKAGAKKFLAQSIAFVYAPGGEPHRETAPLLDFNDPAYGETARAVHSLEQQTMNGRFDTAVVLRNGWLYGGNSGVAAPVDFAPPLHVDAAVYAAFLAAQGQESGIFNVAENDGRVDSGKFRAAFPQWSDSYRQP